MALTLKERQYNEWIEELLKDKDKDTREVARYAKMKTLRLEAFFPCKSSSYEDVEKALDSALHRTFKQEGIQNKDDFKSMFDEGYFSLHGKFLAVWYDCEN